MFTGIIEAVGEIVEIKKDRNNIDFVIRSVISDELKIDQSVAHQGVCLTVTACGSGIHTVTAIEETLIRSNLGLWNIGTMINLERCLPVNGRFDGHIVQGHVDTTAVCDQVLDREGSKLFYFTFGKPHITVEKGSVCVDGCSLTVVESMERGFSVAIIPYTMEHTGFGWLKAGDTVNIEFDIIGKYVQAMMGRS